MTEAPDFLDSVAIREWQLMLPVVHKVGKGNRYDLTILAAYCQAYSRWAEASARAKESGIMLADGDKLIPNPFGKIADGALGRMLSLAAVLGLGEVPPDEPNSSKINSIIDLIARRRTTEDSGDSFGG